ncbi:IclR family transcriptional regulator [Microtetraspora sp. NBRC 13810]|uniref:IclR family transcriptional regulator n=1 Tax=Microtetraspora sp. NBRC 13810 TaxID=3030990 RepID=UPI0025555978|nr:IclR family transcriptional regulator [Microtetraspora sp. NBRC 13810]GLW08981.1 IclR family transcriptional regulator [Microtetraspora sp. NBRC 13810]
MDDGPTENVRRSGRASSAGNAVTKALNVLEATVAGHGPRRFADICADSGVPKASVHRILATLADLGFVSAEGGGSYRAGIRMLALAEEVKSAGALGVGDVLTGLSREVRQTVHLALRSGDHAVYVQKVEADQPYRMASRVGMRLPLHCTAIGKCILAHLPAEESAAILSTAGMPAKTPETITDLETLSVELARIREAGHSIDNEENEKTIRCIGAPVFDRTGTVVGGISVSTVAFLLPYEELLAFAPALRTAAAALTDLLQ